MVGPTVSVNPLTRTDGSASYQCPSTGYKILSSANGPVELPGRRDALRPEESTIEVFVRPGTGSSGVGEQYVKEIIKNMLGRLVLGRERGFPRRGVVITLVLTGGERVVRGDSYLTMLPALLHASLLALLSASVPLSMTLTATVLAVSKSGDIIPEPPVQTARAATSLHALAFSSKGHLLLNESQGAFDFDTWERVHQRALTLCHGSQPTESEGDVSMAESSDRQPLEGFIRENVEDQLHRDYAWKIDDVDG